jgi:hypothetical protein
VGKLAAVGAGLVALVVLMAGAAGAGIASLLVGRGSAPSPTATSAIPPVMLALDQQAATTRPGLPWTVLAAIGTVESDNGLSTLPGVLRLLRSGAGRLQGRRHHPPRVAQDQFDAGPQLPPGMPLEPPTSSASEDLARRSATLGSTSAPRALRR